MNIIIYTDDNTFKEFTINAVKNVSKFNSLNIVNIENKTGLINFLKENSHPSLYIIDVNFKNPNESFNMASIIKVYNPMYSTVVASNRFDFYSLPFLYKIEAMDYILKSLHEKMINQIESCIIKSLRKFNNYNNNNIISIKSDYEYININLEDVIYFETSQYSKKLIVHFKNKKIEFTGNLKNLELNLNNNFFRCHKSFIVNKFKIAHINCKDKLIHMINGDTCFLARNKLNEFINVI